MLMERDPLQYSPGQAAPERAIRDAGKSGIPERLLARLWRQRAERQEWFRTHAGAKFRVLYPGRPGLSAGPDFRGAVLEMEGVGRVRGDVEIHVNQRDWDAHGHTDDPRYNGVALHVALETQSASTGLASGRRVPVASLAPLLEPEAPGGLAPHSGLWRLLAEGGFPRPETGDEMAHLLDRAGDLRFLEKSGRFRRFLRETAPGGVEQTLYEALLEGLGYQHNEHPFTLLAQRAGYEKLSRAARRLPAGERAGGMESWLVRLSGLAKDGAIDGPPMPRGLGPPMTAGAWNLFRVRPANHPRRRMAGAARLVDRHLEWGLTAGLRREAEMGKPAKLVQALTVARRDGMPAAPIGQARARDLAVNVALPFLHALAELEGDGAQAGVCLRMYAGMGKGQENELTREMALRLLEPGWKNPVSNARRQQGLLHLARLLSATAG